MRYFVGFLFSVLWSGHALLAFEYHPEQRGGGETYQHKARVGVVTIEGPIEESKYYVDDLVTFFRDPSIRAIVLVIDSPGGSPGASEAIYRVIQEYKVKYKKSVIVFVEDMCASGGYLIAAAADCIISTSSALVGSIGVIWQTWRFKKFLDQFGIKREVMTAGRYKAVGNPYLDDEDEQLQKYKQEFLQDDYIIFQDLVEAGRPPLAQIPRDEWSNGKIFVGKKALEMRLVDKIGGFPTVKTTVKEMAEIVGNIEWVHPPRREQRNEQQEGSANESALIRHILSQLMMQFTKTAGPRAEYIP
jgi:protease-4